MGYIIVAAIVGLFLGAILGVMAMKLRNQRAQATAEHLITNAKSKASQIILDASKTAKQEADNTRRELKRQEDKLSEREHVLLTKIDELDARSEKMRADEQAINDLRDQAKAVRDSINQKLEKVAGMSRQEAAKKLMQVVEKETSADLLGYVAKQQRNAEAEAEQKAEMLIVQTMERMASEVTAERTVTAVPLPDEEMKGRIIGKEGRNIQALQRATGAVSYTHLTLPTN